VILPSPSSTPSYDTPLERIISFCSPLFFTSYLQNHLQLIDVFQNSLIPCEQHVPGSPDRLRRHVQLVLTDCSEGFRVHELDRWSRNNSFQFPTYSGEHEYPMDYGSSGPVQNPLRISPFLVLPMMKSSMCQRSSKPYGHQCRI
jgi:hypothetical protein